jgi:hypothetical protein
MSCNNKHLDFNRAKLENGYATFLFGYANCMNHIVEYLKDEIRKKYCLPLYLFLFSQTHLYLILRQRMKLYLLYFTFLGTTAPVGLGLPP